MTPIALAIFFAINIIILVTILEIQDDYNE